MPYCVECDAVTAETESPTCPVCGSVLIAIDDMPPEDRDGLVVLTTCGNVYEARVLKAALGEEGIDSVIEDEGLLETINPFHGRTGWNPRVVVRLGDAEAALDLLRRKEAGELTLSEDDLPGEDEGEEAAEEGAPSP